MSIEFKSTCVDDNSNVVTKEIVDTETGVCYLITYKMAKDGIACIPMLNANGSVKVDGSFIKNRNTWVDIGKEVKKD